MLRRSAAPLPVTLVSVLLLSLALAGPALAKEGMQARLDAPIPADTPPGTTIEVGWTTFQTDEAGGRIIAFSGAPVFIALRAPGDAEPATVVFGEEDPSGSGHYSASLVVPDGGIAPGGVTIGLRGESCTDGACVRSDLTFELVDEVLTTAVLAPTVAASPAAVPVTTPDPAPERIGEGSPWAAIQAVGAAIAVVAVLVAVARRRRSGSAVALAPD